MGEGGLFVSSNNNTSQQSVQVAMTLKLQGHHFFVVCDISWKELVKLQTLIKLSLPGQIYL